MPRLWILTGCLLLLLLGVTAVWAQDQPPQAANGTAVPQTPLPQSIFLHPIDPTSIDTAIVPLGGNAGADQCAAATSFTFLNTPIGGVTPNVQLFTSESSDPVLGCMWGNPSRPNGYRTVWYKFTAVTNAHVTVNSATSNYDTVIGVFTPSDEANPCTTLQPVACNDDYTGFTAQTSFAVRQDQTYYVVVADWSAASSGQQTLNIFIQPQPIDALWELVDNHAGGQVTHHDTAVVGADIYVIGGQTNAIGTPQRSNAVWRYHVLNSSWQQMAQMPGAGMTDLTAVHVNGHIYVPGGDDGTPGSFNPTHYVYNVANNFWSMAPSPPVAVGWAQSVPAADQSGYYLIGGATTAPVSLGSTNGSAATYFFDIGSNSWNPKPNMTTARFGHMAARFGPFICVVGGLNGATLLGSGECFQEFGFWQPIASLNIPRFGAGSAIGPDGRWYIFGGTTYRNGAYTPVSSTEVYDPAHPAQGWSILDLPYDLVDPNTVFAREYPEGEFIGNHLYVVGGNHYVPSLSDYQVVPLVQRLYVPTYNAYLPLMRKGGLVDFDDNMSAARPLPFNFWYHGNFAQPNDFYDFYYFDLTEFSGISAQLHGIPSGSDYDLYLFDGNKLLWGSSDNPGNSAESIQASLSPGRYYILVQRVYGMSDQSGYDFAVLR